MDNKKDIINKICTLLFKTSKGEPFKSYPTQAELLYNIVTRKYKYYGIVCPTRYGKSDIVSISTLLLLLLIPLRIRIVAPSVAKTRIIMNYIANHIFDNPIITYHLPNTKGLREQLRNHQNKDHINFRLPTGISDLKIITGDARNKKRVGESVLGEGGDIVVIDESSLIDDDLYAMIHRMIGDNKDSILIELGNTVKRNHFCRTMNQSQDKYFYKCWIDYQTALNENRYDTDFINRAKKNKFFKILYECKFPDEQEQTDEGYFYYLTEQEIEQAIELKRIPDIEDIRDQLREVRYKFNSSGKIQFESKEDMKARGVDSPDLVDAMSLTFYTDGDRNIGVDVGGGGDESIYMLRIKNDKIILLERNNIRDTMICAGKIKIIIDKEKIPAEYVNLDKNGIGWGCYDRIVEQGYNINGVISGESATAISEFNDLGQRIKSTEYANKRSELLWLLHDYILDVKTKVTDMAPEIRFV